MKKTETVEKIVYVEKIKSIICDICGKEFIDNNGLFPVISFSQVGGFNTDYDGTLISFDICNVCMNKIINGKEVKFKNISLKEVY